jgi:hypothetical protein
LRFLKPLILVRHDSAYSYLSKVRFVTGPNPPQNYSAAITISVASSENGHPRTHRPGQTRLSAGALHGSVCHGEANEPLVSNSSSDALHTSVMPSV